MLLRRFLFVLAFAGWVGGFTFYAGVVIPAATELLGSHRAAGFITQAITNPLNGIAVAALAVFFWNVRAGWPVAVARERRGLTGALSFLAAGEAALLALHPLLDARLDTVTRTIRAGTHFTAWHRAYLWISTAQWFAALALLWFMLAVWRREDRVGAR